MPSQAPTWEGFVDTTYDALIVFEACLNGVLHTCSRRLSDGERVRFIRDGSVFVFEESASGIKRWTDRVPWSPSRIRGDFLAYRELEQSFNPHKKTRAKRHKMKGNRPEASPHDGASNHSNHASEVLPYEMRQANAQQNARRHTSPYNIKRDGLQKRTISVTVNNRRYHMVAYNFPKDAKGLSAMSRPSDDPRLSHCHPREELLYGQRGRRSK
ncbi:Global transcription regulator sge1 [Neofusicoccum ribis]|uniref:Global transcription regulator sge1 n=1 Tax=Neofusicoccum ribis TaxID=45134 RepID=A0ABR3SN14_9PEZI